MRGMNSELAKDLPEIGYIVFDGENAIAVAFLRRCEGNYGFVDSAISNPSISAYTRNKAMQMVSAAVLVHAGKLGIKHMLVITQDNNTAERAKTFGFSQSKEVILHKKMA